MRKLKPTSSLLCVTRAPPRPTLAALVGLAASACVSVSTTRLDDKVRPPRKPASVRILVDQRDMPRDCEKVALLHAKGDYRATDEAKMFAAVREKAAAAGANAVLLGTIDEPSTGSKVAGALLGTSADRSGKFLGLFCPSLDR